MRATSIRLEEELLEKIDAMALKLTRPRSWVVAEALKRYVEAEEWFHEAVAEGVKEADAGRVVGNEAVRGWVESWGRDEKAKPRP